MMPVDRAGSEVLLCAELVKCRCKLSRKENLLFLTAFWNAAVYITLPVRPVTCLGVPST